MTFEQIVLVMLKHGVVRAEVGNIKVELHPLAAAQAVAARMPDGQRVKVLTPQEQAAAEDELMFAHTGMPGDGRGTV